MKKGGLLLLPNLIEETQDPESAFLPIIAKKVFEIDGLIAESEKGARRFLKLFQFSRFKHLSEVPLALLNEHTEEKDLGELLKPIEKGETWGLISDAGVPCIADPGSALVLLAHKRSIKVETFAGPSSILMGLQLSGLPAQTFTFHGYFKRRPEELSLQIKTILKEKKTHIFIETPYRTMKLLEFLTQNLPDPTLLCIASSLCGKDQLVMTRTVSAWKKTTLPASLDDKPTVFLLF